MTFLGLLVAAASALSLVAGFAAGGSSFLGLSVNGPLLGVALSGALLTLATLRAERISKFLRIFSKVFAVEFAVVSLAFTLSVLGFWPEALAALTPPPSLPVTLAVFGMIVLAISFIPVIAQITQLADPFFEADAVRDVPLGPLGVRRMSESALGQALVMTLVVLNQVQVGINVRLSFFNRDFFDAIQNKNETAFWYLLLSVFCVWAAIYVVSMLIEIYLESVLKITWREWLTERYSANWLTRGGLYRMNLVGEGADNPDQRIAEDVKSFIDLTYSYSVSVLSTLSNLVSFSIILWLIPAAFMIPGTNVSMPGFPFWVAVLYALVGTWITHRIGRPLVALQFRQERYEADFRFSLARLREYAEQVALLRGEPAEREILGARFASIVGNYYEIVVRNMKLTTFTQSFFQASVVIPYIIVAPYYFGGSITLGVMTQTAGAFSRVESSLTFFIARYQSLASYKAVVDRLTTFGQAIKRAQLLGKTPPHITYGEAKGRDLELSGLKLSLPNGRRIVDVDRLVFEGGRATLLTGPSGSGKSTLFRAIADIWPYGTGRIEAPAGGVMLLPQRPYVPSGTLRVAVTYPGLTGTYDDAQIARALTLARLGGFVDDLDREDNWGQRLSGGEQQRLAIARALLDKPDWLFLDEATSALDETLESDIYRMLREELPGSTIVSIGHRSTLIDLHDLRIHMKPREDGAFAPAAVEAQPAK
ncbi:MAG: transporter [Hyphomicrobiales bacterium]|nr:transporter [Hyphomicrobiales bacterium]